nr:hypothetical protein CFP56_60262 [Quercus suber]
MLVWVYVVASGHEWTHDDASTFGCGADDPKLYCKSPPEQDIWGGLSVSIHVEINDITTSSDHRETRVLFVKVELQQFATEE